MLEMLLEKKWLEMGCEEKRWLEMGCKSELTSNEL